jgi:hypothetical protein
MAQKRFAERPPLFSYGEDYPRALAEQSRRSQSASKFEWGSRRAISQAELPFRKKIAGAEALTSKVRAVQTGMRLVDWLKPFIIGALILLFVIGPGLSAVTHIIGAMPWYLWIATIVLGILIWRAR